MIQEKMSIDEFCKRIENSDKAYQDGRITSHQVLKEEFAS